MTTKRNPCDNYDKSNNLSKIQRLNKASQLSDLGPIKKEQIDNGVDSIDGDETDEDEIDGGIDNDNDDEDDYDGYDDNNEDDDDSGGREEEEAHSLAA